MESEDSLIWKEIKKSSSLINRAGGNTISLLLWSKGKTLTKVQRRINFIVTSKNMDEKEFNVIDEGETEKNVRFDNTEVLKLKMEQDEECIALSLAEQQRVEGSRYFLAGGNSI